MGMGGAITAVAAITLVGTVAITTVGTAATTVAGGIIAIGGDFHLMRKGAAVIGGFFFAQCRQSRTFAVRSLSRINQT